MNVFPLLFPLKVAGIFVSYMLNQPTMLILSQLKYFSIPFVFLLGFLLKSPEPTPLPADDGWVGSLDHPAIQACGCDTLDLINASGSQFDGKGVKYGQAYLCNDSTFAYVQIYLGRGRQMQEVLLWSGRVNRMPLRGGLAYRPGFLPFTPNYRNSYTLKTPVSTVRRTEDVALIIDAVIQDPFTQQVTDRVELYLDSQPSGGITVSTRTIADCCPEGPFPTPVGTAYHYAPPVVCDTVLNLPLVNDKGEEKGKFSMYMTRDSMVFVFDIQRGHLLGKTWIWTGNATPPLINSTTPDLQGYPIQVWPWRQYYLYKLPMVIAPGKCKRVCVYAEVHEIDFLSQSAGFEICKPSIFPMTGQQFCPPTCCYRPETR